MADYVVSRHSAVMERLRRRIELFRRHHASCESRYGSAAQERLDAERQHTVTLHQRCLQTKAKRSSKHRQGPQQAASEQGPLRGPPHAPAAPGGGTGEGAEGEHARSITLNPETVKRKQESIDSPGGGDVKSFSDLFPLASQSCLEGTRGGSNRTSNGSLPPTSPLETKHSVNGDALLANGGHAQGVEPNGACPGNSAPPADLDFRLREVKQERVDDILPCSASSGCINDLDLNLNEQEWRLLMEVFMPDEDIRDIFTDGFTEGKEGEVVTMKTEPSPAPSTAFEPDPPLHTSSPSAAPIPSPVLPTTQSPRQPPPPNLLLPGPLSPADKLKQMAAREQQRTQLMQTQQQVKFQQPNQQPANHASIWPQAPPPQGSMTVSYAPEKPNSPGHFFPTPKQMIPSLHNKSLQQQPPLLDYNNTKPLSHFQGPRATLPNTGPLQTKDELVSLLRQQQQPQQQQQMKQKPAISFLPNVPLQQEQPQNFQVAPHGSVTTSSGGAMGESHGNGSYMGGQNLSLEQQRHFLMGPRQPLMSQQDKHQQQQQLQRHLTRPPPQYQDQQAQQNSQNPFQQPQAGQFAGNTQQMNSMSSLGGPSGVQRMFPQTHTMMPMGMGQGTSSAPMAPSPCSMSDMSLPPCSAGLDGGQQGLYGAIQRQALPGMPPAYRQNLQLHQQQQQQQQQLLKVQTNQAMLKQQQSQQLGRMAAPINAQTWQSQHRGLQQQCNQGMQGFGSAPFQMQPRLPRLPPSGTYAQVGLSNGHAHSSLGTVQMMGNMQQQQRNISTLGPQPHSQALSPPTQQQQQAQQPLQGGMTVAMSDLNAFAQAQGGPVVNRNASLQFNPSFQVNRNAGPDLSFGFGEQSSAGSSMPSFPEEGDLVDSLLKGNISQEWMDHLDELLANHQ